MGSKYNFGKILGSKHNFGKNRGWNAILEKILKSKYNFGKILGSKCNFGKGNNFFFFFGEIISLEMHIKWICLPKHIDIGQNLTTKLIAV